jgi:ubiquinone/menaquinone biosynthesis C-methylase UbiE
VKIQGIDKGSEFDFGKTSEDYAKYRDIYPDSLYQFLLSRGIGLPGQNILDLGTGTGVFPRAMHAHGARFTGIDISAEQIGKARDLSETQGMEIDFIVRPAEDTGLPSGAFDVVTAFQCFAYFDKEAVLPEIRRLLKKEGVLVIVWMAWLPFEDRVAKAAEDLVLKYNPSWTGAGYRGGVQALPERSKRYFLLRETREYDEKIPFDFESWMGRIRACRGVSAALPPEKVAEFDAEHEKLLRSLTMEPFKILHRITVSIFGES